MMKTKVQFNSCGFDSDNLDDWLESDLRQSGILPSNGDKVDKYIKIEELSDWEVRSFCDGSDDKTVVDDSEVNKTKNDTTVNTASSSAQLAPILKAFLTTLQQHQRQQHQQGIVIPPLLPFHPSSTSSSPTPAPSLTPDSINPLHISKIPRILPLNSTTKTSAFSNSNASTTTTKRRRELNSAPGAADVMDPLVLKRLKNTDAARRSRQRKLVKMEGLQTRAAELEKHNELLRSQVAIAENERDAAKVRESRQRERVATLEAQLAQAHQSLLVKQEPLDSEKLGDDGDSKADPLV